jgi:hypothetical protein
VWSPDKHVTFQSDREGDLALFWQPAGGTGRAERLTTPEKGTSHVPESWSPDGRVLLYTVTKGPDTLNGPRDISLWMLSMKDRSVGPFGGVRSSVPIGAVFRPDGRWVAYATGRSSRTSLFVQPFPPTGAMHELSTNDIDSPHDPVWSHDGKELFYNPRPRGFEAVTVNTAETFTFGRPVPLPRPFQLSPPESRRMYDIMPDSRFLGLIWPGYGTPSQVNVVLNWFDELAIKAPADKQHSF